MENEMANRKARRSVFPRSTPVAIALVIALTGCDLSGSDVARTDAKFSAHQEMAIMSQAAPMADMARAAMPMGLQAGGGISAQAGEQEAAVRHVAESQYWRYVLPGERIEALWSSHAALCQQGCEVVQADVSSRRDHAAHARLEMRVDRANFATMQQALEAQGQPVDRNVSREDKTLQVVDLEARMKNLHAMADRLRVLLGNHDGKLGDLLALERELNRVQSEIDSMTSRRRVLARETEKIRLSIEYNAEPATIIEDAWAPVREAWHDMARQFNESLADVLRFLASVAPWVLIVLPAGVMAWKSARLPFRLVGRIRERIRRSRQKDGD